MSSKAERGRRDEFGFGGEGTGHVTALWIACKKKIAADKNMIGVEKMLANLPDLTGMKADKLKQILMTAVLLCSPGDIEQYSNVLGQLARARLAVLENKTADAVDADAVVPRFIYSLINAVVLLHPSGVALGGVARQSQIDTELGYLSGILKHRLGLAGLVESAEQGQRTESEKTAQKHSGGTRRGSAPTIFVRDEDVDKKSPSRSGRLLDGETSDKKRREKKAGRAGAAGDEVVMSGDKPGSDAKSKKAKVQRVRSEEADMGPPPPNFIVPSPPPASPPPGFPGLVIHPVTPSPLSVPPPYSPRASAGEPASGFDANTATSTTSSTTLTTASSTTTTSTALPQAPIHPSYQALSDSSPPVSPRPATLGSARHSVQMQNLDQFMAKEKNFKKFVRDMGEPGSALMLQVIKKLPADYELSDSNKDALVAYATEAVELASLSAQDMDLLASLTPKSYKNNPKAYQLSLMQALIVEIAKTKRAPVTELASVEPTPSQKRVNSLVTSLLLNLEKLDLDKLLEVDLEKGVDDVLQVSSGSLSPVRSSAQPVNSSTSPEPRGLPPIPSGATTSRDRVANYRTSKVTSVPPSPRSFSRESSGDNNTNSLAFLPRNLEASKPTDQARTSAPVSRESSGSDLEDSVGETSGEKSTLPQSPRLRSSSQLNLMQQSAPRKLTTHKRTNTAGSSTTPSSSPEKGSPNKTPENG